MIRSLVSKYFIIACALLLVGAHAYPEEQEKLIKAAMATSVIALLVLGSFVGAPVVEVQCVVALFYSSCASYSNYRAMDVARHFLSPVQSMTSVDAIAFNIAFMYGVPVAWFIVVVVFSTCIGSRTFRETCRLFAFPAGPLIVARVFLPGLWYNVFQEAGHNQAAVWVGVIAGCLLILINLTLVFVAKDLYYVEPSSYGFLFPDTTYDVARSYLHVVGRGASRFVIVWWTILPIIVCGITTADANDWGKYCNVPWGFLTAIWWLMGAIFAVFRPHGTLVRSAIYVLLYFVCGVITLTILVEDDTASSVFCFALLAVVILLLLHSGFLWLYTFCERKDAPKKIDDRGLMTIMAAQFRGVFFCCLAPGEAPKGAAYQASGGGADVRSPDHHEPHGIDQELEEDRRREMEEKERTDREYDKSFGITNKDGTGNYSPSKDGDKLKASKNYGVDGRQNDGSAFDMRRESEDERLAREYRNLMSGDAKGYAPIPEDEKGNTKTNASANASPSRSLNAVSNHENPYGNSVTNQSSAAASSPSTVAAPRGAPSGSGDVVLPDEDEDPRAKRRREMEQDMQEYYDYAKKC